MKNFKLNGLSINDYEGKGKPLIFIHAFPLCSRMWDAQVNYFKDKYRIITYDIRGLGYSNELKDYIYTMEELSDDFFNILDELKIDKVNACGLSVGGYILLRSLVRDQSRFNSVILADTKSEADDNAGLISRSEMIKGLKAGRGDEILSQFVKKLLSKKSYENNDIRGFVEKMISWNDVKGMCAVLIAIATRTNTMFQLRDIAVPALVITGKSDIVTPPARAFYLREYMQNSELKIITGAGHISNMEAPEEFNKTVEDFLNKLNT